MPPCQCTSLEQITILVQGLQIPVSFFFFFLKSFVSGALKRK